MPFEIDDQVVYPAFGIGRVVNRVTMAFGQVERQEYYEIAGERSTVYVPVDESNGQGLRPLTRKDELPSYREVLCGQPGVLNPDFRQRHLAVRNKARQGTLLAVCEVVRDLSARGWRKPLSDGDSEVLRRSRLVLCEEWAAADKVSVPDATAEVDSLLRQGKHAFQA